MLIVDAGVAGIGRSDPTFRTDSLVSPVTVSTITDLEAVNLKVLKLVNVIAPPNFIMVFSVVKVD